MALDVVLAGKHNGSTHAAVAETDRSYCHWVMNAAMLPRSLLPFKTWLKRTCMPRRDAGPSCPAILPYMAGGPAMQIGRAHV